MKYRIAKHDALNWAILELKPAGEAITQGPEAGTVRAADVWATKTFHAKLEHAAVALLQFDARQRVGETPDAILAAIKAATAEVIAVAQAAEAKIAPTVSAGPMLSSASRLTEENKKEILASKDPVGTYKTLTNTKRIKRTSDEKRRGLSESEAVLERVS